VARTKKNSSGQGSSVKWNAVGRGGKVGQKRCRGKTPTGSMGGREKRLWGKLPNADSGKRRTGSILRPR